MGSHGQMLAHLAKRGIEMMNEPMPNSPEMDRDDMMQMQQEQWNDLLNQLPVWGIGMVVVTMIVMYLLLLSVSYTIGRVVMTLAMIETPTVDYIPIATLDNLDSTTKDTPSLLIDGEAHTVINNKPITSKIRGTIRHLTSHAGFFARWRGLGWAIIYNTLHGILYFAIASLIRFLPAAEVFAATLSAVALASIHCAWTHKMITMPSQKSFFSRIPPRHSWRQLWIPNAVAAASGQASLLFIMMLTGVMFHSIIDHEHQKLNDSYIVIALKLFALISVSFFLGFFVVLPNYAALTRIEATLLPDEEDTIVPFDRTFGGKVTPVVVGGSGFSYVKEVCRTFDREARIRIMKLFFKGVAIAVALFVVYVHIVSFEMFFVIGPVAKEAAKKAGARMMRM